MVQPSGGGIGQIGSIGKAGSGLAKISAKVGNFLGNGGLVGDVVRGVLTNSATQGIAIAAGLQKRFDWTGVATAGVMSGAAGIVSRSIGGQAQNNPFNADGSRNAVYAADGTINKGGYMPASSTNNMISGAAGGLAGAAARSLVTGTDFGDNIMAVLPDVIGQTVGSIIGRTLTAPKAPPKLKVDKNAYGLDDDRVTSPPYLVAENTGFITDGSVTYTQNAGLFNASGKLTGQVSAQQVGQARSSILGSAQKARAALAVTSSRTDKPELVWHNGVGEWVGSGGMGRIEALAQNMFDSKYMKWLPGEYKDGSEYAAHLDYLLRQGQEEQRFNTVLILGYQASKAGNKFAGFYRDTAEKLVALDPAASSLTQTLSFASSLLGLGLVNSPAADRSISAYLGDRSYSFGGVDYTSRAAAMAANPGLSFASNPLSGYALTQANRRNAYRDIVSNSSPIGAGTGDIAAIRALGNGASAQTALAIRNFGNNIDGISVGVAAFGNANKVAFVSRPTQSYAITGPVNASRYQLTAAQVETMVRGEYQSVMNSGYAQVLGQIKSGDLRVPSGSLGRMAIGREVDRLAEGQIRRLNAANGWGDDMVQIKPRIYGSNGRYTIPDIFFPQSGNVLDGSIGLKSPYNRQVRGVKIPCD